MKRELCINTSFMENDSDEEILDIIKNAGFDAVFTDWFREIDLEPFLRKAESLSLRYHSLHAPFYGMDDIWHDDEGSLSDKMMKDLFACADDCCENGIDIMICHAIIGMDNHTPTDLGVKRLEKLIEYAEKKKLTIAFENTEGKEYLDKVFSVFGESKYVGFCFDSGHEMCYTPGTDLLKEYGKYLVSTHLDDNLGQTGDEITFYDDAHLLPFDGKGDWENISRRMHDCGYDGTLTFELNYKSRPTRHENDKYSLMSTDEYVNEAFRRACKFREMFDE